MIFKLVAFPVTFNEDLTNAGSTGKAIGILPFAENKAHVGREAILKKKLCEDPDKNSLSQKLTSSEF